MRGDGGIPWGREAESDRRVPSRKGSHESEFSAQVKGHIMPPWQVKGSQAGSPGTDKWHAFSGPSSGVQLGSPVLNALLGTLFDQADNAQIVAK